MRPGGIGSAFTVRDIEQPVVTAERHRGIVAVRYAAGFGNRGQCPHAESVGPDFCRNFVVAVLPEILQRYTANVARQTELACNVVACMDSECQPASVGDGAGSWIVGDGSQRGQLRPHVLNGCLRSHGCVNVGLQGFSRGQQFTGLGLCLCGHGVAVARQQLLSGFDLCGPLGLQLWNGFAHG